VSTELTADALVVDTSWSPEQIAHFQREIASREGPSGYYHQYTIRDRSGQTLRTIGPHPCVGVLASLDRFGFPKDFTGKTVLDIGCNSGFYSFAAKLRGARSVLGVDYFQHCVDQATLMREILQVDVDFRQGDGETLRQGLGPFDIVLNTGVIYHLQNPMQMLSNMAALTGELMFLESEMLLDPRYSDYAWFIEREYCADGSNWWVYGPNCVVKMARAAGFSRAEFKGFVWTPPKGQKTPEGFLRQGRGIVHCWK
jgi:protein-L-isoaspartate O-methyltransferase